MLVFPSSSRCKIAQNSHPWRHFQAGAMAHASWLLLLLFLLLHKLTLLLLLQLKLQLRQRLLLLVPLLAPKLKLPLRHRLLLLLLVVRLLEALRVHTCQELWAFDLLRVFLMLLRLPLSRMLAPLELLALGQKQRISSAVPGTREGCRKVRPAHGCHLSAVCGRCAIEEIRHCGELVRRLIPWEE